jgi:hypothetical protein
MNRLLTLALLALLVGAPGLGGGCHGSGTDAGGDNAVAAI